jgi:hypothetical protein
LFVSLGCGHEAWIIRHREVCLIGDGAWGRRASVGVRTLDGAYGANGTQQHSEDGLPSKNEKELIGMPSGELIPDPDANLTEAEKIANVRIHLSEWFKRSC